LGFGVWGLRFGVWGARIRVSGFRADVQGLVKVWRLSKPNILVVLHVEQVVQALGVVHAGIITLNSKP
jgi:hypothetical protein